MSVPGTAAELQDLCLRKHTTHWYACYVFSGLSGEQLLGGMSR